METEDQGTLTLAENFKLPRSTVTHVLGILAMRGTGKSYLASVLMEELVSQGLFVGFVDPLGIVWGIRSSADGEHEGLPVLIFGGRHGDIPLDPTAGKRVAQAVLELLQPFILDLSLFDTEDEQRAFLADFIEAFRPCEHVLLHLIIDEADIFAPQTPQSAEAHRSCRAMNALARRYRYKGIGATFICQRPAELYKGVMQFDLLLALCITQPHDAKALDAWIKSNATAEERATFLSTLASLPVGTAWAWSPRWLRVFERIRVRTRNTYDSSRTPDVDSIQSVPKRLADINLGQLRARLETMFERAKETDPAFLQQRICELEAQLRERSLPGKATPGKARPQARAAEPGLPQEERARYQAEIHRLETMIAEQIKELETLREQAAIPRATSLSLPNILDIGQATVHEVVISDSRQTPTVVEAVPPKALPAIEVMATVKQRLVPLCASLSRLAALHQRIWRLLVEQEGTTMNVDQIASHLYMQPSSIPSLRPLTKLGIVQQTTGKRGKYLFRSTLRQHLRERFPRLDAEQIESLVQHVLSAAAKRR